MQLFVIIGQLFHRGEKKAEPFGIFGLLKRIGQQSAMSWELAGMTGDKARRKSIVAPPGFVILGIGLGSGGFQGAECNDANRSFKKSNFR
jgi:hypothetical protein